MGDLIQGMDMHFGINNLIKSICFIILLVGCSAEQLNQVNQLDQDAEFALDQNKLSDGSKSGPEEIDIGPLAAPPISLPAPSDDEVSADTTPIETPLNVCSRNLTDEEDIKVCFNDLIRRKNPCLGQDYDEEEIAECIKNTYEGSGVQAEEDPPLNLIPIERNKIHLERYNVPLGPQMDIQGLQPLKR